MNHGISDVDTVSRWSGSSVARGVELFAPVSDLDPLKAVIDPVTTALGLPIAGLKTLRNQGTMGFYFRVDENLPSYPRVDESDFDHASARDMSNPCLFTFSHSGAL
jgi:hypothetical protein